MNSIQAMSPVQVTGGTQLVQWLGAKVSAGFPSAAEDFAVKRLDLDRILNLDFESVFFMRVAGHSMQEFGIFDNDIVAIDKYIRPHSGHIVVVSLDREFLVKQLKTVGTRVILQAGNPQFKDIELQEGQELECWGVVTATIKVFPSGVVHVRPRGRQ